jgi:hypothetical protein
MMKLLLQNLIPVVIGIDVGAVEPFLAPLQEFEGDGYHVTSECALVRPAEQKKIWSIKRLEGIVS